MRKDIFYDFHIPRCMNTLRQNQTSADFTHCDAQKTERLLYTRLLFIYAQKALNRKQDLHAPKKSSQKKTIYIFRRTCEEWFNSELHQTLHSARYPGVCGGHSANLVYFEVHGCVTAAREGVPDAWFVLAHDVECLV